MSQEKLPDPFTPIEALRKKRFYAAAFSVVGITLGSVAEKWALTQNEETLPLAVSMLFLGSFIGMQEAVSCHDELKIKEQTKNNMIDQLVYEIQSA